MVEIKTVVDTKRGCGWRAEGGLYLMAGGEAVACGKLPLPLDVCPVCHGGIKPTRGWTWVNPAKMASAEILCSGAKALQCWTCPLGGTIERAGLLWIGEKFYATPRDFSREAIEQGISRRISAIPNDFEIGKTWVLVAHRKTIVEKCPNGQPNIHGIGDWHEKDCECEGEGKLYKPGVFASFRPTRIEYVVKGTETEEELERMEARGITPVRVVRKKDLFDEPPPPKFTGTEGLKWDDDIPFPRCEEMELAQLEQNNSDELEPDIIEVEAGEFIGKNEPVTIDEEGKARPLRKRGRPKKAAK